MEQDNKNMQYVGWQLMQILGYNPELDTLVEKIKEKPKAIKVARVIDDAIFQTEEGLDYNIPDNQIRQLKLVYNLLCNKFPAIESEVVARYDLKS